MPPRFAFWTILLDGQPTAFRARQQEELLPTLTQLRRTNPGAVMKWFARGRLWESPEEALDARALPPAQRERRSPEWRPGGKHQDPRARFSKPAGSTTPGGDKRKPRPAVRPFAKHTVVPGGVEGRRARGAASLPSHARHETREATPPNRPAPDTRRRVLPARKP
jgi:hypothetical protein